MRGISNQQIESLVALTPEDLVPQEHPIRRIKPLADRVLQELSPTFSRMYAKRGRPSVPPEHLLKASLRGHEATALSPGPADEPSRGVRGESAGAKRVEEVFGWLKTVGGGRKLRYCGVARNGLWAEMALAAYNLVRMAKPTLPPSSPGAVPAG